MIYIPYTIMNVLSSYILLPELSLLTLSFLTNVENVNNMKNLRELLHDGCGFIWDEQSESKKLQFNIDGDCIDYAAKEGRLDIIKWIHAYDNKIKCTVYAMDNAAYFGHIDILDWL